MSRFRKNPGFERELRSQPAFVAAMRVITDGAAASIRQAAPVETGYYRRSITARGTRIHVADPFWHLVEFGSINNPPYAPVRRGIRSVGLRLDESQAR